MIFDDIMGPFLHTVCPKSATGREVQWKALMAQIGLPRLSPRKHELMKTALIATSPGQLKRWKQMSPTRRDAFIARVVRQGQSGYHSHMRDIYAAYTAEQVFHALKD